jgi:hypothetical protein
MKEKQVYYANTRPFVFYQDVLFSCYELRRYASSMEITEPNPEVQATQDQVGQRQTRQGTLPTSPFEGPDDLPVGNSPMREAS